MTTSPDPTLCPAPACGKPNNCGLAAGQSTCWCLTVPVNPGVLSALPLEAQNKACVCATCAAQPAAEPIQLPCNSDGCPNLTTLGQPLCDVCTREE